MGPPCPSGRGFVGGRCSGPRIRIAGATGAGKTIAARAIGASLGVAYLELDAIHWYSTQPMYQRERSDEDSVALPAEFLSANDAWVIGGG